MPPRAKLSVCQKLLIAAYKLERQGTCPFTAESLVVAAWQAFPRTFGLTGFEDDGGRPRYPDSNRVFAEIMGSKPIRKNGWLVKTGEKLYQLTDVGRDVAVKLEGGDEDAKLALSRDLVTELGCLIGSRATRKIENGQLDDLTFHDACLFWGITPRSAAIELEGKLAATVALLEAARRQLAAGGGRFQHGGQIVSSAGLDLVQRTHEELQRRFASDLSTIMARTDQRKA